MYPDNESYYQRHRLRPRAPTPLSSDAIRQLRRKTCLWIAALLLELCITLSVCSTAALVLAGERGAGLFAMLRGSELGQDILGEQTNITQDAPAAPTVRILATGASTRNLGANPLLGGTSTGTPARPVSNTGLSNTKPNVSPTRAPTLTPLPAGKTKQVATPTVTRTPTRTPTATATRIPPTPYPTGGPPPPPGTCILGCR